MSGKSKKKKVRAAQTNAPWSVQVPYLTEGFERAKADVLERPRQFYNGPLVAEFSPEQEMAFRLQSERAIQGSPGLAAAEKYNTDLLNGDYLGAGNPYLRNVQDAAARPLIDNYRNAIADVGSTFSRAGRYGSGGQSQAEGLAQQNLARQLSDQSSQLAYQNYSAERDRMAQAAQFAPTLAQAGYADIDRLAQVGANRQALQQAQINSDREKFDFDENEALQRLGAYMSLVNGNYGGTQSGYNTVLGNNSLNTANTYYRAGISALNFLNSAYSNSNSRDYRSDW